jgi:hypothetical protein
MPRYHLQTHQHSIQYCSVCVWCLPSNVGHEGHAETQVVGNLALVNVARQGVGDDGVLEDRHVVSGVGLGAGARVTRQAEDAGSSLDEVEGAAKADLGAGRVAAGVGDALGLGNLGALDELGKTVGPYTPRLATSMRP